METFPIYYKGLENLNEKRKKGKYQYDDNENYYNIHINDHIVNRYQIIKKLGRGTFGNVVLGFDHKKISLHAIKLVRNEPRFINTTSREIIFLNDLRGSKYIINLEKDFEFNNHICLVFECFGIDLYQKYIKKKIHIEHDLYFNIIYQILKGLDFIHSKNIIHLDLKPENILISKSKIKIIDFGSSIRCNEKITNWYVQSRWYRSPEALLEYKYNYTVDIWSYGCVVYELFTLKPLFSGKNTINQIYKIYLELGCYPDKYHNNKYLCNGEPISIGYNGKQNNKNALMYIQKNNLDLYNFIIKCIQLDCDNRLNAKELVNDSLFKNIY